MPPKRTFDDLQNETAATIELDTKKRVSVRLFNGMKLVDIREFYEDKKTNTMKPGSKGISLNEETWKKLLESADEISAALKRLGDKKAKTESSDEKAKKNKTEAPKKEKSEELVEDSEDSE